MTHDELLANIDYAIGEYDKYSRPYFYALRAVVELHKPNKYKECGFCMDYRNDDMNPFEYPCPTIQAIEKELK